LKTLLALEHPSRIALNASIVFDASVKNWIQLLSGHTLVLVPDAIRADAHQLWRYFARHAVNLFDCTPVQLQWLLDAGLGTDPAYQPAQVLIGGEAISPEVWSCLQALSDTRFINVYGPTECTVDATACVVDHTQPLPTIGKPLANTRLYILDAQGQPVPIGVTGELHIGGAGVARGYLHRPDLTADRFIADPFSADPAARLYKTGDLARWQPDGRIDYLGRNDFQIKVRGFRIEAGEIESRLLRCPGVQDAVVIAREDHPGDTRLVAYLCAAPAATLTPASLRQQLAASLADYMIPSAFVTLDALPLTPNGKLDRQALPVPDQTAFATRDYEAPQGNIEIMLAALWQDLLGLERVGRHDRFFALGGHSLLAVQLLNRLDKAGISVPLATLFAHPTLCDLAAAISGLTHAAPSTLPVADRTQPLPLSFAQQRLWFLAQLDPAASQAYHLPAALRLSGQLDRPALTAALDGLMARHESLRTRFTSLDGQPAQQISPDTLGFSLACHDLRELDEAARTTRVAELAEQEARAPFDLTQGPLIRGQLLQLDDDTHVLLLTQHHIISDGWSIGILARELAALYQAAREGHDAQLPPLPVQYADYAVWQRQWLQGETLDNLRDYWRRQLESAPALLTLPTDRPRPSVQRYAGDQVPFHLDMGQLHRLHTLSQQQGTTLFMTLLAAWSVVLSRLSGQDDIVIGTPVANRPRQELEGMVGFFVNTLALRAEPGRCHSVADLLDQVRERALDAYAHQALPFEQVVEVLQPVRNLSYSPLFQVMLSLNNTPTQALTLPGLELSVVERPLNRTHFDLSLSLIETENGLDGGLIYATDLFERDTIIRVVGYVENILMAMADDVMQPLNSLPMLPEAERQQVLVDFNATEADFPRETLIQQQFEAQAEQTPEAIAVLFEGQHLTYRELNRRANQLAHHLLSLGVKPDDRVALCVERSLEMMVGLLGILKAGAAYVPMDPAYPAERLAYMLDDAAPVALLTQSAQVAPLSSTLPTVLLDTPASSDYPDTNPVVQGLNATHLAYVIYTSGSTGKPKGVMVAHRNVLHLATGLKTLLALEHPSRIALNASIVFDASVKNWIQLLSGHTLVLVPDAIRADAHQLWRYFARHAVNLFDCTPVQLQWLLDAGLGTDPAYQPAQVLIGGEAISPEVWSCLQALSDTRFINVYGPTECTVDATACVVDHTQPLPTIGKPLANTRLYILDAQGQPVPIGVTGELHIGGAGVARGYLHRPDLTADRFIADPFSADPAARLYKTGDLARWQPDGRIDYLGRNDFQIKVRGFRIEAGEIES
ncbi:amino acid adenylation domain-containing protein, partial [Pectobacterium brasiliense]|uniref:amino acid adenylation domain-containing protein n=2 Tax=Pectobacterium brasiliense TaxID=180957 RepID=UPI002A7EEA8E